MQVYNTLKTSSNYGNMDIFAEKNTVYGYGLFKFSSAGDAELAIKLAEKHADNILSTFIRDQNNKAKILTNPHI